MFFEKETLVFKILDVFDIEQENINIYNYSRNFDALSFRYESDVVIESKNKQLTLSNNAICFFPSSANYTRIGKQDRLIVVHFKTFNYQSTEIQKYTPKNPDKYRTLFEELLNCWNAKGISYKHEAASILNRIFAELYKDNRKKILYDSKIFHSMQYIEENCLEQNFSLEVAAQKSNISDTYFRRLFAKEYGISPKKYIIERRIKYAASLIITGYYTLQEISSMCGYNDYKHFSVEFKKIIGVSPSKYTYDTNHYQSDITPY